MIPPIFAKFHYKSAISLLILVHKIKEISEISIGSNFLLRLYISTIYPAFERAHRALSKTAPTVKINERSRALQVVKVGPIWSFCQ